MGGHRRSFGSPRAQSVYVLAAIVKKELALDIALATATLGQGWDYTRCRPYLVASMRRPCNIPGRP
jgi:hypothetical protein